jgi:multidrug efflux system membrane fusion protein
MSLRACLIVSFAFAGALALAACAREKPPSAPPVVPVTVVKAESRDMPVLEKAVGTVEAINSVNVTSMIDGQLLSAEVSDGQDVTKGQLLFRIDPRPAEAALHQAEAALSKDRATLDQARSRVKRYQPVAAKGFISADQMEQYETDLEAAEASVKVDQANIAAAKINLGYTDIRAPIAGRLGRILVQPGNLVKANDVNPLVVLNQIEPIYVSFALPGREFGRVLAAQKKAPLDVSAAIAGVDEPVSGRVAFIDNAVDTASGTIRLRGEFGNGEHMLWPGLIVNVTVTLGREPNAVVVPDRAVQNGQDGSYVFVIGNGDKAELRNVTVDRSVEGRSVIAKGLAVGETVVLDGQSRLENGSAVKVTAGES